MFHIKASFKIKKFDNLLFKDGPVRLKKADTMEGGNFDTDIRHKLVAWNDRSPGTSSNNDTDSLDWVDTSV